MKINPQKCVACGNCTYICPMGAIYVDPELKRATINREPIGRTTRRTPRRSARVTVSVPRAITSWRSSRLSNLRAGACTKTTGAG